MGTVAASQPERSSITTYQRMSAFQRFADAGPPCAPRHHHGAGIRKPSQMRKTLKERKVSASPPKADAPASRPVQRTGVINSRAILGELHHRYARVQVVGTHSPELPRKQRSTVRRGRALGSASPYSHNVGFGMSARRNRLNVVTAKLMVLFDPTGANVMAATMRALFSTRDTASAQGSSDVPLRRYTNWRMKNIAAASSACSDPLLLERQVRPFGDV
jgi:hypothetical protein